MCCFQEVPKFVNVMLFSALQNLFQDRAEREEERGKDKIKDSQFVISVSVVSLKRKTCEFSPFSVHFWRIRTHILYRQSLIHFTMKALIQHLEINPLEVM